MVLAATKHVPVQPASQDHLRGEAICLFRQVREDDLRYVLGAVRITIYQA
jgi:hypothetical protein